MCSTHRIVAGSVYEAPLGYSIEDVHPNGGIKKFKSSVYSSIRFNWFPNPIVLKSCRSYNKVRWLCLQIGFEGYEKKLEITCGFSLIMNVVTFLSPCRRPCHIPDQICWIMVLDQNILLVTISGYYGPTLHTFDGAS
ncbi:hypothetical protein Bca4012_084026 [Brassica carinata]